MIEQQTSQIKVRSARAAKANAERAIANAQATYRASSGSGSASVGQVALVAPISGTVTHLDITRGQAVERTQVLLEVENLNAVWVTANVPEKDAAKVRTNSPVTITVAALPGREFQGFIQIVGGHIDSKTRAIPVQCLIASAGGALVPDMFATVHLGVGGSKRELVVPKSAIVTEDRKAFVFVKVDGKFEKREVELGSSTLDSTAVLSGLKEGEQVAIKGAFVLQSESKKEELKGEE
jgi:cobalt-zinc-cadmium efflux system membrane fusion protein